ncbi:MAG TPA: ATP-binding cassette domain-containing protein [Thermodesulfobacteriota bacterium]|nr:ATP-binding cassette domain-containing protein [Thermodesulfobacteriota bacterium]
MIEVEGLTKFYGGFQALKGISFTVEKGEILGFLGPNGAGKTTTMRILTCFFPATGGKARVAGFDVFEDAMEVRKRLGYLPENVPIYMDMVAEDYLKYAAGLKGVPSKEVKSRVERVMDDVGITHMKKKLVREMSKGYRQRLGLAQSLVNDPEVLILDEPTIGLDPKQIIDIRKLIKDLAGRRTVILCTHILPEVSMVCSKVVIINDGRLVAVDSTKNLTDSIQGSKRVVLKVEGPSADVSGAIKRINGVKSVEVVKADGVPEYRVDFDKGRDSRADIPVVVVSKGWKLLEMKSIEMSLEDVFVKLVTKE